MRQSDKGYIKTFILYTYLLFWILFFITGGVIYLKAPQFIQTIMKYVCAWTSTFVFLVLFKKIYPNYSLVGYLKKQFTKVSISDFAIPMIIQLLIIFIAIICVSYTDNVSIKSIKLVDTSLLLQLFISNIIYGPMGEELGWRCYALNELQKKYSPLISSLIIGFLWALWHSPLWFMSGYTGRASVVYILFFMIGIMSLSIFLTFFYNRSKSILIAIWIHFLFNYLLQIVLVNNYTLIIFTSLIYLIAVLVIVVLNKKTMLQLKKAQT